MTEISIASFLITVAGKCFIGGFFLIAIFKLFDKLTPDWDFEKVFSGEHFTGGSIVIAALLLAIGLIAAFA